MSQSIKRKLSQGEAALLRVEYGRRLREARKAAGYETVSSAASVAGVNETVLRQWELGRSSPSLPSLDTLICRLALDPAILFPDRYR